MTQSLTHREEYLFSNIKDNHRDKAQKEQWSDTNDHGDGTEYTEKGLQVRSKCPCKLFVDRVYI